jgi:hypothetical protein
LTKLLVAVAVALLSQEQVAQTETELSAATAVTDLLLIHLGVLQLQLVKMFLELFTMLVVVLADFGQ